MKRLIPDVILAILIGVLAWLWSRDHGKLSEARDRARLEAAEARLDNEHLLGEKQLSEADLNDKLDSAKEASTAFQQALGKAQSEEPGTKVTYVERIVTKEGPALNVPIIIKEPAARPGACTAVPQPACDVRPGDGMQVRLLGARLTTREGAPFVTGAGQCWRTSPQPAMLFENEIDEKLSSVSLITQKTETKPGTSLGLSLRGIEVAGKAAAVYGVSGGLAPWEHIEVHGQVEGNLKGDLALGLNAEWRFSR